MGTHVCSTTNVAGRRALVLANNCFLNSPPDTRTPFEMTLECDNGALGTAKRRGVAQTPVSRQRKLLWHPQAPHALPASTGQEVASVSSVLAIAAATEAELDFSSFSGTQLEAWCIAHVRVMIVRGWVRVVCGAVTYACSHSMMSSASLSHAAAAKVPPRCVRAMARMASHTLSASRACAVSGAAVVSQCTTTATAVHTPMCSSSTVTRWLRECSSGTKACSRRRVRYNNNGAEVGWGRHTLCMHRRSVTPRA